MTLPFEARPIDFHDVPALRAMFGDAGRSAWCYFAPFLVSYHLPPGREVLLGEWRDATWIVQKRSRDGDAYDLVVPPEPFSAEAVGELQREVGSPMRVLWAEAGDAERAATAGWEAREKDRDLIYDPRQVADLEGAPYRDLRKRVHRFEREQGAVVRPMGTADVEACDALLRRWRKLQGRRRSFLLDWGYTRRALASFASWPADALRGWVLEREDGLQAFALAGPLTETMACFFVLKGDPTVRGASDYLRWSVFRESSDYERVNDAGDLDLPGLRQQKRKFRPVDQVTVYSFTVGEKGVRL